MSIENMPDERLITFYENIREQADADRAHKHRFMGPTVRQYADRLRGEMVKRRLQHSPIDWPGD
jgi:hypothetical protein